MVDTVTLKYNLVKPEISGSPTTWGNKWNANADIIDGAMDQNKQAGVPVGSVVMFVGTVLPTNWLACDGSSLSTATYAALFAIISYTYGGSGTSFNVPNFAGRMPLATTLNAQGGEATHTLALSEIPAHSHPAYQDAHVHAAWQDVHTHSATQPAHNHGDTGHSHGASASQDGHTHTIAASGGGGFGAAQPPNPMVAGQGSTTTSGASANNVYVSIGTGYANLDSRQPAITVDNRQPGVYTDSRQPAVYTQNAGGGAAHNNLPPYLGINFIIKYQ